MSDLSLWADYLGTTQRQARRYAEAGLIYGASRKQSGHWIAPLTEVNKAKTAEMMRRAGEFDAESMWRDDFDVEAYVNDPPEPRRTPKETREFNRMVDTFKRHIPHEDAWEKADSLTLAAALEAAVARKDINEESIKWFRYVSATCYTAKSHRLALANARSTDPEFDGLYPSERAIKIVLDCRRHAPRQLSLIELAVAMRLNENHAAARGRGKKGSEELRRQLDALKRRKLARGGPKWVIMPGDIFTPLLAATSKPSYYRKFPAARLRAARRLMLTIDRMMTDGREPKELTPEEDDTEAIRECTQGDSEAYGLPPAKWRL